MIVKNFLHTAYFQALKSLSRINIKIKLLIKNYSVLLKNNQHLLCKYLL